MARDFDRLVAEIQVRVAVLNRYTTLGIPVTVTVGYVLLGKGDVRSYLDLCMYGCHRWCKWFLNGLSV